MKAGEARRGVTRVTRVTGATRHPAVTTPPARRREAGRLALVVLALALVALLAVAVILSLAKGEASDRAARSSWQRSSRTSQLELLPVGPEDVVFLGASLVQYGEWSELLPDHPVRNRGVAGDKVDDAIARLAPIVAAGPRAVFVMVGLNDVLSARPAAEIEARHRELVRRLQRGAPATRVVLMSLLPVRRPGEEGAAANAAISLVNQGLARVAAETGCELLDLVPLFSDAEGALAAGFTVDGVHLNGSGYRLWSRLLDDCGWL